MSRAAVAALAGALVALGACRAEQSVGDVPGVLFGAAVTTNTSDAATQEAALTMVEAQAGRRFDLDRIYRQWDDPVPGARELWTIQLGRTPIVSFKATSEAPWPAIANGDADAKLAAIAAGYVALPAPVLCIFDQDPENTGGALGTPADYAAAYRHVVETFRTAGAANVQWIFNLKSPSFPDLADLYYPGDDVIDWLGTSAYNFGVGDGGRWVSFADLIADFVAWATPHGKPLIVTEWASDEDPGDPDRKATWIADAAVTVHATPKLRAMSAFWSLLDGTRFDTSLAALDAFRVFAADPYTNLRAADGP
ncbi:MAG TPA: hypothetical protein VH165_07550 [Kofleriaceae bacterium]|nr:hypothetical protein [Kofleriaceae bacterium]